MGKKRKNHQEQRVRVDDWDQLAWAEVKPAENVVIGDDVGGFYCLEELEEDVDCVWEEVEGGGKRLKIKVEAVKSKKQKRQAQKNQGPARPEAPLNEEEHAKYVDLDTFEESPAEHQEAKENKKKEDVEDVEEIKASAAVHTDVSAWSTFGLHEDILQALASLGFTQPTEIQAKTLPHALERQDIVGAAETGSGKTLAFGIPIVQHLLSSKKEQEAQDGLTALILAPTRELAIQVKQHLTNLVPSSIVVASIVGGMAIQKQERLLSKKPHIIVATPGRLWEMMTTEDEYAVHIRMTRFLVLDEADRMIEKGHFSELENILKAISLSNKVLFTNKKPNFRQTFVFSATLGKDLSIKRKKQHKKQAKDDKKPASALDELFHRIEFHNPVQTVDLTNKDQVASSLAEARIECLKDEKDLYLYYFFSRYPGRTLVFVNSIDAARRLLPMLKNLKVQAFGLHAQMQQRQRLKNIDRFKASSHALLIATDVAARGLDIPLVEHVIHYQVPRSGEIYVHRSGRTARAGRDGISVLLISPDQVSDYKKICQVLHKPHGVQLFPIDHSILSRMKQRVHLAREIDIQEHRINKGNHEEDWFVKNAKDLDIELDEQFHTSATTDKKDKDASIRQTITRLRQELNQLLQQPLLPRGQSAKYLTSNVIADLAERLLNHTNQTLPTVDPIKAVDQVKLK